MKKSKKKTKSRKARAKTTERIIVELIEALKSEHLKMDAVLKTCWKIKSPASPSIVVRTILLLMRSRVKSLVDNLRRSGDEVSAKIIEDDFEVIIQAMNAGIKDMQELLMLWELVRDFGRTLNDTEIHLAVKPESPLEEEQKEKTVHGEALALATKVKHPDWSDKKIAEAVGVNRTTLYTWKSYMKSKEYLEEQGKNEYRDSKGFKNGETGEIDVWEKQLDTLDDT